MSNAIKIALAKEEAKLARQIENHESTQAVIQVLGDSAKERNKLDRQVAAMEETKSNIAKLKKAIK